MKYLILTIMLCHSLVAETIYSRPNIYKGNNYYSNGRYIGQSRPNLFRGQNYYDNRGRYFMRSYPTYNGGQRYQYSNTRRPNGY